MLKAICEIITPYLNVQEKHRCVEKDPQRKKRLFQSLFGAKEENSDELLKLEKE